MFVSILLILFSFSQVFIPKSGLFNLNYNSQNPYKIQSSAGESVWMVEFSNGFSLPQDMITDKDGNIYITGNYDIYGENRGGFFLIKYNKYGEEIWNKTIDTPFFEVGRCLFIDKNDFIYVTGSLRNSIGDFIILMKFNLDGELIFRISPKIKIGDGVSGNSIKLDSNGNIYIAGETVSKSNIGVDFDFVLLKFNKYGKLIWYKVWGGKGQDQLHSLTTDSLGNIYVSGRTTSLGNGGMDAYVAKFSANGRMVWERTLGSKNDDAFHSVKFNHRGDLVIIGEARYATSKGDNFIVILDKHGVLKQSLIWGDPLTFDIANGACFDENDYMYVYGRSHFKSNGIYMIRLDKFGKFDGWINFNNYRMEEILDMELKSDNSFLVLSISNRFEEKNTIYLFKYHVNFYSYLEGEVPNQTKKLNRLVIVPQNDVLINFMIAIGLTILFFLVVFKLKIVPKYVASQTSKKKIDKINQIKKTLLQLSTRYKRISLNELLEKTEINDIQLLEKIIKSMIKNQEVYGEYFSTSQTILFDQKVNIDQINKLMHLYKDWEEDKLQNIN